MPHGSIIDPELCISIMQRGSSPDPKVRTGHRGVGADASFWKHDVSREYRSMLLAGAVERSDARISRSGELEIRPTRKGMSIEQMNREKQRFEHKLEAFSYGNILRCRVRYFTDGAVIGSKAFVNEIFLSSRQHFSSNRKEGARKLRGSASAATEFCGVPVI